MATRTADTVSNILQMVADRRGEPSTSTDNNRIRLVSKSEEMFAKRRFWDIHSLRNQTTTGDGSATSFTIGSATYPMRFRGLFEVFVGGLQEGNRYTLVNFNEYKLALNSGATKLVYETYDQANDLWKMVFSEAPDNGATIYYSYYYMPPKRTATTDSVICYDMDYIVNMTLSYLYESERDYEVANVYKKDAEDLMAEMMSVNNTPSDGQRMAFGSSINPLGTTNRGIGGY